MKNLISRILCLLLVAVMALSMAACQQNTAAPTTEGTTVGTTEGTTEKPTEPPVDILGVTVDNPINYFTANYATEDGANYTMSLTDMGDGTAMVIFNAGGDRKQGNVDPKVFHFLTAELAKTDLEKLNGTSQYGDGAAYMSFYATYTDNTMVTAEMGGKISAEMEAVYNAVKGIFASITADMPVYVPEVQIMGEVDEAVKDAMLEVLNNAGISDLDTYALSTINKDEYFAMSAGLSSDAGIASGTVCSAMMMTTPYSFVVVTLEDGTSADAVAKDFEANINWQKWVCVTPTNALIAVKDNMVLCVMGADSLFSGTKTAVENAGWSNLVVLDNPNM